MGLLLTTKIAIVKKVHYSVISKVRLTVVHVVYITKYTFHVLLYITTM